jgi:hypothetical protein
VPSYAFPGSKVHFAKLPPALTPVDQLRRDKSDFALRASTFTKAMVDKMVDKTTDKMADMLGTLRLKLLN